MKRWPTKPLAEIAKVVRGVSFDKTQVSDAPRKDTIPILRAGNIQVTLLTDSDLVYVPEELVSEEQRMKRGDLAICMSSGSPAIVGKTAHLLSDWHGSVGAFCAIVRFNTGFHHRFGSYWFRSPAFLQWRNSNAKGANIQNLRRTDLENLQIPVPSLAEQERIVKLLDEADELRKLRAQADTRTVALLPAVFYELFGESSTDRKCWPVRFLGDVIDEGPQNGLYKHSTFYGDGTPILRIDAFYDGEVEDLTALKRLRATPNEIERYGLHQDDIVINRVNSPEYLGKSALIPTLSEPTVFESNMMRFKVAVGLIEPGYLIWFLQTPFTKRHILGRAKHSINQSSINQEDVKCLPVLVPPLSLQKEFAHRVTEIREFESAQAASRERLEALFQSMLHRAFNGEL